MWRRIIDAGGRNHNVPQFWQLLTTPPRPSATPPPAEEGNPPSRAFPSSAGGGVAEGRGGVVKLTAPLIQPPFIVEQFYLRQAPRYRRPDVREGFCTTEYGRPHFFFWIVP